MKRLKPLTLMNRIALFLLLMLVSCNEQNRELPILNFTFGSNGTKEYFEIGAFSFKNQLGVNFTNTDVLDKIYVANFFFTKCPSICPPMNRALNSLALTFINDDEFLIVSHTIDPKNDTLKVLRSYAEKTKIPHHKRIFLTGEKNAIKKIAKKYMTSFTNTDDGKDFHHSSIAVLVDKNQNIRGFYNTLISGEMEQLEKDIKLLKRKKADL